VGKFRCDPLFSLGAPGQLVIRIGLFWKCAGVRLTVRLDPAPRLLPGAPVTTKNLLYYGDNLDVLRKHIKNETVDLIYLDPPFKSDQSYNVLFRERDGTQSAAQVRAFEDTWHWDESAALAYRETVEAGGQVAEALRAFRILVGDSDMLAYLSMMAPRLRELCRVLKPTGSLCLHCDPSAGHYLKLLLDAIFGPERFLSEVIWKRTSAHSSAKRYGPVHDVLLCYTKSESYTWNRIYQPYDQAYIDTFFDHEDDDGRRWKRTDLTGAGTRNGETGKTWRGINVTAKGRHWALPPADLDQLEAAGKIHWPAKEGGMPRLKQYADEMPGVPLQDVWTDIPPMHNLSAERLGYPTQKPLALLERIISASSNAGDVVLDPFCGCGTAIDAAHKLGRRWIGIDITQVAIGIIRHRMERGHGIKLGQDYEIRGEPTSLYEAASLAEHDRFQFQAWAVNTLAGRPVEQKKGKDKGIDGKLFFHDEPTAGVTKTVIISVKSGTPSVRDVRDLRGVIEREKAAIGVLVLLEDSTRDMRTEAADAGLYHSPMWSARKFPRIQIITIEKMLADGLCIQMPPVSVTNVTLPPVKEVKKPKRKSQQDPLFDS
jgi:DNA modification methylase